MADRLLFSKTGRAKYISHLDLMRTFQRAFARAKIAIKHTEGFHPHPFVSIALPLSVGFSSACEVLECQVLNVPLEEVPARMNAALPAGITVTRCYEGVRPVKELCYVNYIVTLEYESGAPFGAERDIQALLERDSLVMTKRSKKAKGWGRCCWPSSRPTSPRRSCRPAGALPPPPTSSAITAGRCWTTSSSPGSDSGGLRVACRNMRFSGRAED